MPPNIRLKTFFPLIRFLVASLIIVALFTLVPYDNLFILFEKTDKTFLSLAFSALFMSFLAVILRWKYLLWELGLNVALGELLVSYLCSLFFNLFIPMTITGDVLRGLSVIRRYGNPNQVAWSILVGRVSGFISLALISALAFLFNTSLIYYPQFLFPAILLCLIAIFAYTFIVNPSASRFFIRFLWRFPSLGDKLSLVHQRFFQFKIPRVVLFYCVVISFGIYGLTSMAFYFAAKSFHSNVPLLAFLVFVPIVLAASHIPVSSAGIGPREALTVYFMRVLGVSTEIGLGIALINLFFIIAMGLSGGLVYVFYYHRKLITHPRDVSA